MAPPCQPPTCQTLVDCPRHESLTTRSDVRLGHMTRPAISPDRIAQARKAAAEADIDALLVTPGPDLRWLTGYDALPLERLTCLVLPAAADPFLVAPGLEVPAV